jgi:hypothetical protein
MTLTPMSSMSEEDNSSNIMSNFYLPPRGFDDVADNDNKDSFYP